tara:strand:- start:479 stop:613 length:135 start_codon:yes stop_codon:yes gene_type:complete
MDMTVWMIMKKIIGQQFKIEIETYTDLTNYIKADDEDATTDYRT